MVASPLDVLRFTSCQAPNAEPALTAIMRFVGEQIGMPLEFKLDVPWQDRLAMLDAGTLHAAWICGLPYIRRADQPEPSIELLMAPVMRGERYQGRPIYFSDVVVRADSRYRHFDDLRGARWAFNERGSHSGYNVMCWHLATHGLNGDYFGGVIGSGSHQRSLRMILDGEIDASAIDSTVLETELRHDPSLAARIRRLEPLGPSPIPPWVVNRSLAPQVREQVRQAFLTLHEDSRGRELLAAGDYARFVGVMDEDYDRLREMTRLAQVVSL
ncbi:MAG: PhnD/SsuA/transferrin family substrate-binding protein [Anaerolineae bacterium]|nr:PhnD/SsuA/transferrin family substrate-binding protein [Anaerolineae bacterium]